MHIGAHSPPCCEPPCLITFFSLYCNAQTNSTKKRIGGSTASHRIIYLAGTLTLSTQLLSIREMLRRIYSLSRQRLSSTQSPYLSIMAGIKHGDSIEYGATDTKLYFTFITFHDNSSFTPLHVSFSLHSLNTIHHYSCRNPTEISTTDHPSNTATATRESAASYLAKYHEEAALKG